MAVTSSSVKKRKKIWVGIYAPKILNSAFLGESNVYSIQDTKDKTLSLNLSTFTNDMRKQNTNVNFKIVAAVDNKAVAGITGISLTQAYVKRLVRRGRDKVDDSFTVKSKDNKVLRVKPLVITNSKTTKTVNSKIRLELRVIIANMLKNTNSEEFFANLINQRIQKGIKEKLSKIYPVKFIDIRQSMIEEANSGYTHQKRIDVVPRHEIVKKKEEPDETDMKDEEMVEESEDETTEETEAVEKESNNVDSEKSEEKK